jgi:hypothetical protein
MKRNRSISSTGISLISNIINVTIYSPRISFTQHTKVLLTIYSQIVDSYKSDAPHAANIARKYSNTQY